MLRRILLTAVSCAAFMVDGAHASKQEINILFVGKTQTGKSTLINIFYNHILGKRFEDERAIIIPLLDGVDQLLVNVEEYKAYDVELRALNQSQTSKVFRYTAENEHCIVHLWDAPGFNDTNRQVTDEEIVRSIAEAIGETSFNAVAFVLKPNEPNSFDMEANIDRIRTMLPKTASKNIIGIYTRAGNLSKGVRKSGVTAFANLLKIPHGSPLPNVYHMDGSSFFSEVNLEDSVNLLQGQARWMGDGAVVAKVVNDAAKIEPFHAADVLTIQNTIQELEKKIDDRKDMLTRLDETMFKLNALETEKKNAAKRKEDNKDYVKEKEVTISEDVPTYSRRFWCVWLCQTEDGKETVYHKGIAKFDDEEQKNRYFQALDEIDNRMREIGVQEGAKASLEEEEKELLKQIVDAEKTRRELALASDLDSFLVYLNEEIRKAKKNPDEELGEQQLKQLRERRSKYERIKNIPIHSTDEL